MSKQKRSTASYLAAAKRLSPYVPGMKRFRRRKTLKPWEKSYIARYENLLRFTLGELQPLTKKQAKEFKGEIYHPESTVKKGKNKGHTIQHGGIRAVRFRNVGRDFKLTNLTKDAFMVKSNKRVWLYWRLNEGVPGSTKAKKIKDAGVRALLDYKDIDDIKGFDLERLIELSEHAFSNPETKAVYLWAEAGRVGEPQTDMTTFLDWVRKDYATYQETDKWVKGIAVLIADVDEYITDAEFTALGKESEKAREERKRRQEEAKQRRRYKRLQKSRGR